MPAPTYPLPRWAVARDSVGQIVSFLALRYRFAPGPIHVTICGPMLPALVTETVRTRITSHPDWTPSNMLALVADCSTYDERPAAPSANLLRVDSLVFAPESAYVRGRFLAAQPLSPAQGRHLWVDVTMVLHYFRSLSYPTYYFIVSGYEHHMFPH